ncbi:SURF1 family protein [Roseovarius sp. 217]|uniref:SURF1 family protein n=1 Tax=Roseovarius sp. (strain 217) TaxID=314264 RepID=UPI0000686297|nr:SURF1 family protein [Roseovarius sp. 217]EAQ25308.1 SURF1 family protein [Roseovarius sp. 217]
MRKSILIPLIFGIAGVAVLIGLGKWQVERLARKEAILADIAAHISAPPVALPDAVEPEADRYLPVAVTGQIGDAALRVLVSQKQIGAGYRVISALDTDTRRVLLDRGFIRVSADIPAPPAGEITVTGNLHWPDERLSSTPENDVPGNIWFARDIEQMAEVLETEPVLIVARALSVPEVGVSPLPVDTSGIPNDHLSYAITWFSLAAIWAAMTGVFIWRQVKGGRAA